MRNVINSNDYISYFVSLQHTSVYLASRFGNIEYLNKVFDSKDINITWKNYLYVSLLSYSHLLKSSN